MAPFPPRQTESTRSADGDDASNARPVKPEGFEWLAAAIEKLVASVRNLDRNIPIDAAEACRRYRLAPDTLRRIPTSKLPKYKPGRVVLYYPDDLDRYVCIYCVIGQPPIEPLANPEEIDLDALADKARGCSRKRRTPT